MPDALTVGSLFTGVGGFDLGLERAGMRVVWQCEQNEFCQRVLAKHWPDVPCYPDVCALVADTARLREARVRAAPGAVGQRTGPSDQPGGEGRALSVPVPYVDVLCGGFPCQDISLAGKGAGLDGARSGLWFEYARIIRELRPRYVIVENVPALRSRGLHRVLSDLAACGFDAEWDCIPASAVGAPHQRDRLWLVAYTESPEEWRGAVEGSGGNGRPGVYGAARLVADPASVGQREPADEADTIARGQDARCLFGGGSQFAADAERMAAAYWPTEPDVGRVADGVPARVDRLRALGNALVPQIAEWIGHRIVAYEGAQHG